MHVRFTHVFQGLMVCSFLWLSRVPLHVHERENNFSSALLGSWYPPPSVIKDRLPREKPMFNNMYTSYMGFPGGSMVKNPPDNTGDIRDESLIPGSGRSPGGEIGRAHV